MKINLNSFFKAATALVLLINVAYAQGDDKDDSHTISVEIPEVALLDLETSTPGDKNFTALFTHSTEAGDPITAPSNNTSIWLNYSSILKSSGASSRNISVSASAVIPGVTITVIAGSASVDGKGTLGTPSSLLTLSTIAQDIINGVGSAYTVTGATKGHQLTYAFIANDANYAALRSGTTAPITVTYTLSDN